MELSCKLNCGMGARIGAWTQAYNPTCRPVERVARCQTPSPTKTSPNTKPPSPRPPAPPGSPSSPSSPAPHSPSSRTPSPRPARSASCRSSPTATHRRPDRARDQRPQGLSRLRRGFLRAHTSEELRWRPSPIQANRPRLTSSAIFGSKLVSPAPQMKRGRLDTTSPTRDERSSIA